MRLKASCLTKRRSKSLRILGNSPDYLHQKNWHGFASVYHCKDFGEIRIIPTGLIAVYTPKQHLTECCPSTDANLEKIRLWEDRWNTAPFDQQLILTLLMIYPLGDRTACQRVTTRPLPLLRRYYEIASL